MYDENQFYHYSYRKPEEKQSVGDPQNQAAGNPWQPAAPVQPENTWQSTQPAAQVQPENNWQNSRPAYQPQPVWEGSAYHSGGYVPPVQQPVQELKPKKKRTGLKIAALALACALLGGAAGTGATLAVTHYLQQDAAENAATVNVSNRPSVDVVLQSVDGHKLLTDAENYAVNVNSAVSINCSATTNYFGQTVQNASSGSGFVLTADGYIVTNHHVIDGATKVTVTMYNGDTYEATVIGSDEDYDIGVIKVEATGLRPVIVGNSEKLNVGDRVLAIGNPLGELTFSQTGGMVSSVNRAINVDGTPFNMIQTDTSVNPGNSGGPLFNSYGEVVGIVTAKYSIYSDSVVEGLGFAIPINDVMAMIQDIMANGYVTNKPYMGISGGTLTSQMAAQYRYNISGGVFVYSVEPDSGAAKAGLQMGDVVRKVDDYAITSLEDLAVVKKQYSAGDTVTLTVYRDGQEITLQMTWGAQPAEENVSQNQSGQGSQGNQGGQTPSGQNPNNYYGGSIYDLFEDFFNQYGGYYGYGGK